MIVGNDVRGYSSFVTFTCPFCSSYVQDVVFVPESSTIKRDELGFSTQGKADIYCGRCAQSYRLEVRNSTGRVFALLVGHPRVPVSCSGAYDPEEFDGYLPFWDISDSPSDALVDALKDVDEVIRTDEAIFYTKPLSRMAFIQQFAALEAYLADTLTKAVLENPHTLSRALTGIKDLKEIKLSLAEVAANPDIVKVTAASVLKGMLYHNFMKVDAIWNVAFGFSIFPTDALKLRMLQYEPIRHDCVHRNGRDKQGVERAEIDFKFVIGMGNDIHALLDHIEDNLHSFNAEEE